MKKEECNKVRLSLGEAKRMSKELNEPYYKCNISSCGWWHIASVTIKEQTK